MRRSASGVIRNLEMRVARLERSAKSFDSDFERVMKKHQKLWMSVVEDDIQRQLRQREMFFPEGDYPAGSSDEEIRDSYTTKTYESFYKMWNLFKRAIANKDSELLKKYMGHRNTLYKAMASQLLMVDLPKSDRATFPLIDLLVS